MAPESSRPVAGPAGMSAVAVRPVSRPRDLRAFVAFPFELYRGHPLWVPPLKRDVLETFDPDRNPAYAHAETRLFLARRGGRVVGRVAAILNHAANRKWGTRNLRFGWFDAIDDLAVAEALFHAVAEWGRERGMETLTGPHGFCDLDPQGMLIEGFDELPTIAVYYNYPYYPRLLEHCGFEKEVDYVEYQTPVPHETGIPERLLRLRERLLRRGRVRVVTFPSRRALLARAPELFALLDETFEEIYGTVPLTPEQREYYIRKYIGFVDPRTVKVAVNASDELVGFMLAMPSLSRAFQKARGRIWPLGWWHLWRGLRRREILDFYLAGVKEGYRNQGVDLLMVLAMAETALEMGFRVAESNPELETNTRIQAQWKPFGPRLHKRRRIYRKPLVPAVR